MRDKMPISAYILKIVEKNPFLRLQMRAKEDFNHCYDSLENTGSLIFSLEAINDVCLFKSSIMYNGNCAFRRTTSNSDSPGLL